MSDQGTKWLRNINENFNRLSMARERYRQATDRWTTASNVDVTFANDCHHGFLTGLECIKFVVGWRSAPDPAGRVYSAPRHSSWFMHGVSTESERRGGKEKKRVRDGMRG